MMAQLRGMPERVATLEEAKDNSEARQDRHEDMCTDRYNALDGQMVRLHERIDKLLFLQLAALLSTGLALAGMVVQSLRHGS